MGAGFEGERLHNFLFVFLFRGCCQIADSQALSRLPCLSVAIPSHCDGDGPPCFTTATTASERSHTHPSQEGTGTREGPGSSLSSLTPQAALVTSTLYCLSLHLVLTQEFRTVIPL